MNRNIFKLNNHYFNYQVEEKQIHELVKEEILDGYVECSALRGGEKVNEVFQKAGRLSLIQLGVIAKPEPDDEKPKGNNKKCNIF